MTSDIFTNLEAIRHFLTENLVDEAPAHLRSEIRAAAKLLKDISAEMDVLPALLFAESRAMMALAKNAILALETVDVQINIKTNMAEFERQLAQPMGSLHGLLHLHEEMKLDAEAIILALQSAILKPDLPDALRQDFQQLLHRYYHHFGEQADARSMWQSVFPAPDRTEP